MLTNFGTPALGHTPSLTCDGVASACGDGDPELAVCSGARGSIAYDCPLSQMAATLGSALVFCKEITLAGLVGLPPPGLGRVMWVTSCPLPLSQAPPSLHMGREGFLG